MIRAYSSSKSKFQYLKMLEYFQSKKDLQNKKLPSSLSMFIYALNTW